jgi:WD40 repeat protein
MATMVPALDAAPQQPDALEPKSFKYAAFISYSHEDRRIGAAIQSKLEKYVLPRASQILGPDAARRPFARVFRDEDELVPGESLPRRIHEALENSQFLVVVCSPTAATNDWVEKELIEFIAIRGAKSVIAVVVDGEPNAGRTTETAAREALPRPLRFVVEHGALTEVPCDEPLWLDWRGDLQNDRLTFLRLVAALLGLNTLDDLVRRDQERERAARRLQRRIIVGVSVLALLAAAAAVVAFEQRQNALEVQSTQLAREAGNQSQAFDNAAAATLALAALPAGRGIVLPRRSTAIAERALVSALSLNRLRAVFRHEGPVSTVRFNHSGSRLITSSGDGSAAILDVKTWKPVVQLRHQQGVSFGVFSADDRFVATACDDGTAAVWNADNGSMVANLTGHRYAVTYVEFSPDGRRVLTTSSDGTVRVWDADSGAQLHMFGALDNSARLARYNPNGHSIVAEGEDGKVHVWSMDGDHPSVTIDANPRDVSMMRFSADGARVAVSEGKSSGIWDATTGRLIRRIAQDEPVTDAVFSPDATRLVVLSDGTEARVLSATTGATVSTLKGHVFKISNAWFSKDGSRVLTTSVDGTARVWIAESGLEIADFGHVNGLGLTTAQFSQDGQSVATATADGLVQLWDASVPAPAMILKGHSGVTLTAQYSPDGTKIVTSSADKTAIVWDARTGSPLTVLRGHTGPVWAASFNRDGSLVATGSMDKTGIVWDARSGERVATLSGHINGVAEIEFSPDSEWVLTASRDWQARVWNARTGALVKTLQHKARVNTAHFSPDGQLVLSASADASAMLWNRANGDVKVLRHAARIVDAVFSPSGRTVATASGDGTVRVWDARTGTLLRTLAGHSDGVNTVAYTPNGSKLLSVGDDGYGLLWDVETGAQTAVLTHQYPLADASVSPDGRFLATVDTIGMVQVWTADGAAVSEMTRSELDKTHVRFSPDSRRIILAGNETTVAVWSVPEPPFPAWHERGPSLVRAGCDAIRAIPGYTNAPAFVLGAALLNPDDPPPCDRAGMLTLGFYRTAWCSAIAWGCSAPVDRLKPVVPLVRPAGTRTESAATSGSR